MCKCASSLALVKERTSANTSVQCCSRRRDCDEVQTSTAGAQMSATRS